MNIIEAAETLPLASGAHEHNARHGLHDIAAGIATLALLAIAALAFSHASQPYLADKVTLLALGLMAIIACWTPCVRWLEANENASAFGVTAAMFIVYGLARNAGPKSGITLTRVAAYADLPPEKFVVSYAALAVVAAAILTLPYWIRHLSGWTGAVLGAIALIGILAVGSLAYLGQFYKVGATETLDPSALPYLLVQIIEYGALALTCNVACSHPLARRCILRALPLILILLFLRHRHAVPMAEEPKGDDQP